jgi:hypothetical protein
MKNRLLFLVSVIFISTSLMAQKDTCRVGVYINSVYDFKLDDKSYMADFWMWINYKNDSLQFENVAEITNSKSADFSHYSKEKIGGWNWVAEKCRAQLIHQWDVSKYPFDRQLLRIEIEDAQYDTSALIYMADKVNSKIDNKLNSSEWCIENFTLKEGTKTYNTNYGNPILSGNSTYPNVVAEISIRRNGSWVKLVKMLTGAYVAFLISCIVFFISSENQDSRFGLCVGGVFAAIGNKYIVESIVPSSTSNTLMDNVHTLTFIFILLIIITITISLRLFESGDEKKVQRSHKIDKTAFFSFCILYTLINCWMVYAATRGD